MNVEEYDKIANGIFAPAYPLIAKAIVDETKITKGVCLDLGCGTGTLGINLAKITNLNLIYLDRNEEILDYAKKYVKQEKFEKSSKFILSDVHILPFEDNSVNLAISRGSVFFWENLEKAFNEIVRILKPGGYTYIGGGFGSKELKEKIFKIMEEKEPNWSDITYGRMESLKNKNLPLILGKIKNITYEIIDTKDVGYWIIINKIK